MNIPVDKIPDLTAIYYYTGLAMDFAKSFPDKINFNLPLEVVGFSTLALDLELDFEDFDNTFEGLVAP